MSVNPALDKERLDLRLLTIANFEGDKSARGESVEGLRDEAAIDFKSIISGKQGESRFVVADFDGEGIAICLPARREDWRR